MIGRSSLWLKPVLSLNPILSNHIVNITFTSVGWLGLTDRFNAFLSAFELVDLLPIPVSS